MRPIIIIPARLAAQRLPGKPLADINGKPMIMHVLERAYEANLGPVVIACCGQEIYDAVVGAGGQAVITDPDLPSGTDRIFAALQELDPSNIYDCIINLQGDLPTIFPEQIRQTLLPLRNPAVDMSTLVAPFKNKVDAKNPNAVKVVLAAPSEIAAQALYFSRAPIPYNAPVHYHHIGIYAFRRKALETYVSLPPSPLEQCERLEQLRALEAGLRIDVAFTDSVPQSIDSPEDLEVVRALIQKAA